MRDPGTARCCWTIVTRATLERRDLLQRRLRVPVAALVLDDDGPDGPAPLLGADLERYAAGFDRDELSLAVLPRLLTRALADGANGVAYVDANADFEPEATGALASSSPALLHVDPWPAAAGPGDVPLHALVLDPWASAPALLERWAALVQAVLREDRVLTARTTLRWLRTLALSLTAGEIVPAGFASRVQREHVGNASYRFASLANGLPLTPALRALIRDAHEHGRFLHPFSDLDAGALMKWLAEPAATESAVPRYLTALVQRRPDLSEQFDVRADDDAWRLLRWARQRGVEEDPVLAAVLAVAQPSAPANEDEADEPSPEPAPKPTISADPGVNVVGYWRSELGVADAARLIIHALDAAEVPLQPIAVRRRLPVSRRGLSFASTGPERHPFGVNLLCLNPDGVLAFHEEVGDGFFAGRPTIGYWWWELLDSFPPAWKSAFELVHEVWVGSHHVHAAIAPVSPVPVRIVPIPVMPLPPAPQRSQLCLPEGFLFVTVFDYNSAFERKNPAAVVAAFRAAFPPGSGAFLLVKSINADRHPDDRDELAILAAGHPDIHLRDGYVSSAEIDALLACADCVVSLHRAEGFGLPLARALRSRIPVIATAYGGNLDFMDDSGYLVGHSPATVPPGTHYPAGASWVEPDIDHAGMLLRQVFEQPQDARRRAAQGSERLARTHSVAGCGARMAAELRRIGRDMPRRVGSRLPDRAVPTESILELRRQMEELRSGSGSAVRLLRELAGPLTNAAKERRRTLDRSMLELLARLADAEERHAIALRRLEDAVGELSTRKADALDTAALLAALRAQHTHPPVSPEERGER